MDNIDLAIKYILQYQKDLEMVGENLLCKLCQITMEKPYKTFIPNHLQCKSHMDKKSGGLFSLNKLNFTIMPFKY